MDKFVIRRPRGTEVEQPSTSGKPQYKQTTIESLKGVVVIEEIHRLKSKLLLKSSTKEEVIDSLQKLGQKIPPRKIMLDTKIGKIVNKFRENEDKEIRRAARKVYVKWKTHFTEHAEKPLIEVKCDLKTEKMRTSGRKFLCDALSLEEDHNLPDAIEREVFHSCKRLINFNYRRTMRTLVFTLKNNEDVRTNVLSGELKVPEFVKTYKKG